MFVGKITQQSRGFGFSGLRDWLAEHRVVASQQVSLTAWKRSAATGLSDIHFGRLARHRGADNKKDMPMLIFVINIE